MWLKVRGMMVRWDNAGGGRRAERAVVMLDLERSWS